MDVQETFFGLKLEKGLLKSRGYNLFLTGSSLKKIANENCSYRYDRQKGQYSIVNCVIAELLRKSISRKWSHTQPLNFAISQKISNMITDQTNVFEMDILYSEFTFLDD